MSEKFEVTKSIDIQYAHRVMQHGGKCRKLHGHRGTLEVTVCGELHADGEESDMVMDFDVVQKALDDTKLQFCHKTLLHQEDPVASMFLIPGAKPGAKKVPSRIKVYYAEVQTPFVNMILLPFSPTAERLAQLCYEMLGEKLNGPHVRVSHVRFWETARSVATYPGMMPVQKEMV